MFPRNEKLNSLRKFNLGSIHRQDGLLLLRYRLSFRRIFKIENVFTFPTNQCGPLFCNLTKLSYDIRL